MASVIASLFSHARPPLPARASYLEHRMLPTATATRLRLHPAARLARSFRLARDLALEFRIDPGLQPRVTPESMGPIGAHHMAFPSKENPNPTIPVARVLGRQTTPRGQRRGIPHGQARLVAQRRPCHREHGARAAVGQTA